MRVSKYLLPTLKENPADAEIISHQLMLRAGMIRKQAAGIYNWLPLGLRVLRKVEAIVREEMNRSGAMEVAMPIVQPAELWQESGRWEEYGPELCRFKDRHERDFCLGPTHEEIVTDMMRREIRSYRQLPANFYQIATKFRDEIRPRFGIMRAREFLMKDAYSFHSDEASLRDTYQRMYEAYSRIFTRVGVHFRAVEADSGAIGGSHSHEFHVLAKSGEDIIAYCDKCDYAANLEMAITATRGKNKEADQPRKEVDTPGQYTIEAISKFLQVPAEKTVKTLFVHGAEDNLIALILRGDHMLNETKAANLPQVAKPLCFATDDEIYKITGCRPGSLGPVDLKIPVIVDQAAMQVKNFICGANRDDKHYVNVNWERDCKTDDVADLRQVCDGDGCSRCDGTLRLQRGIEVGHIFQLGTKYSKAMRATVLDEQGHEIVMPMGCYGIGVSRVVAAAIEQNHDEAGIIWPEPIAPFTVCLVALGSARSSEVKKSADGLYEKLTKAGFDVLFDDRDERPGSLFADADLVGIPHRLVVSERNLKKDVVEYKRRGRADSQELATKNIIDLLNNLCTASISP